LPKDRIKGIREQEGNLPEVEEFFLMTMRLLPTRPNVDRRPSPRRPHVVPTTVSDQRARELTDERRWRQAGGPLDRATYACACGKQFEAAVSTSVACPSCGAGQSW
jgi:hypothetical protein